MPFPKVLIGYTYNSLKFNEVSWPMSNHKHSQLLASHQICNALMDCSWVLKFKNQISYQKMYLLMSQRSTNEKLGALALSYDLYVQMS